MLMKAYSSPSKTPSSSSPTSTTSISQPAKGVAPPSPKVTGPNDLQKTADRSPVVSQAAQLQAIANSSSRGGAQPAQLTRKDKKFDNDDSEFIGGKDGEIHVHDYPSSKAGRVGHLRVGGTHRAVTSKQSAKEAYDELLQQNAIYKAKHGMNLPHYGPMKKKLKEWEAAAKK